MFEVGEFVKIKKNVIDLGKKYKFKITEVKEAFNPACINVYKIERDKQSSLDPVYGPYDYQLKKIYEIEDRIWREDELEPYYGISTNKIYIDNGLSSYCCDTSSSISIKDVKLTVDNPIYDYFKNIKEDNMKILDIYKERKEKEFNQEYNKKREELIAKDTIQNIINEMQDQVNAILESEEAIGRLKVYEPSIFTKDTEKNLEKIGNELDNKREELRSTLEEIRALFEMTEDYQERMKILKRYDIIDKNGKLSI